MDCSLCMMADFQNGRISRIFSVFWSGFLHRTTLNDYKNTPYSKMAANKLFFCLHVN